MVRIIFYITNKIPFKDGTTTKSSKLMNSIKRSILRKLFKHVGKETNIRPNIKFIIGNIKLGDGSSIGEGSYLQDGADIIIGKDVMMGPKVSIYTTNHGISKNIPMWKQKSIHKSVIIEDEVWIGHGAIILPGRKIGYGSVVGAGSVITKDVPPFAVVGGNPAKILKYRE